MKFCSRGSHEKEDAAFARLASGKLYSYCNPCRINYQREYRLRHPEKYKATWNKWAKDHPEEHLANMRRRKYGVSVEDVKKMEADQGGVCAICGGRPVGKKNLSVDHCHATGKIRGMLCDPCNRTLGNMKDSPELLLKAHAYLLKFSS